MRRWGRWLPMGCLAWGVAAAAISLPALPEVNHQVRWLVGIMSVVLPACAVGAASAFRAGATRLGAAMLLLSAMTPTYFAWALNLPALVIGTMLVVVPSLVTRAVPQPVELPAS